MEDKICSQCGKEFPLTSEFFHRDKAQPSGFRGNCKDCRRIECKERYYKDIEKTREKMRQYGKTSYDKKTDQEKKEINKSRTLHQWVKYHKDKQGYCSICNEVKRLELSNLSGKYKRDITDYWWLCHECHALYDIINKTHQVVV